MAFNVTLCPIFERRSSNISAKPCAFPVSEPYNNVIARFQVELLVHFVEALFQYPLKQLLFVNLVCQMFLM